MMMKTYFNTQGSLPYHVKERVVLGNTDGLDTSRDEDGKEECDCREKDGGKEEGHVQDAETGDII